MKKLIAFLMVCSFAMAFVACGGGAKTEAAQEETAAPAEETTEPAPDTATVSSDTTAM